jgi:hypothetical protein
MRHFVLYNVNTEELHQDQLFTTEDAQDSNERLAADGSEFRWIPWVEE